MGNYQIEEHRCTEGNKPLIYVCSYRYTYIYIHVHVWYIHEYGGKIVVPRVTCLGLLIYDLLLKVEEGVRKLES